MKIDGENYRVWPWVVGGVATILALIVIGWAAWGFGVATSGVHGRGEQIKKINDATNRTFAQEHFQQEYHDVLSFDQQLTPAKAQADTHRETYAHQTDNGIGSNAAEQARLDSIVTGLETQCIQTRNTYNADANKISQRQFQDANLPYQIDATDPTTDCQP